MRIPKLLSLILLVNFVSAELATAQSSLTLRFPIADRHRSLIQAQPIVHMDHDSREKGPKTQCSNFNNAGFPYCYNNHRGTDYLLLGGFVTMDNGSAQVVAAAAGTVTRVVDGNYDRCSGDLRSWKVSCHGHKKAANLVVVEHAGGLKTRYLHLKKGSIRVKRGQRVKCGQFLGLVGSSGESAMPHLHFEILTTNDRRLDPYGGRNSTQRDNFWAQAFAPDGLPSGSCKAPRRAPAPEPACRWEQIQDGAQCGFTTISDAAACGTEVVKCGTEIVKCGTELVTDAAICGTKTVTSAATCGVDIVSNLVTCVQQGLEVFNGACNVPRSCNVPDSCRIDVMCEVDKMCESARSCPIANTCNVQVCDRR